VDLCQTPWTDADQSLTIRTLLLTVGHGHGNTVGHPPSSPALLLPPAVAVVSFNREDVESMASLRLMSPGAASDGVTLCNFFLKNLTTFFSHCPSAN